MISSIHWETFPPVRKGLRDSDFAKAGQSQAWDSQQQNAPPYQRLHLHHHEFP